jgi:hypothetical protein
MKAPVLTLIPFMALPIASLSGQVPSDSAAPAAGAISACVQAGATADAKITAALALVPHGGVVDARCFGRSFQKIASTVIIGAPTNQDIHQTLILDPATYFVPASPSLNMFTVIGSGSILGLDAYFPSGMTYSGSAVVVNAQGGYIQTMVEKVKCDASNEVHYGYTSGTCILLTGTAHNPITFLGVSHIRCLGLNACIDMTSAGGGYVNGNNISDVIASGSGAVLQFDNLDSNPGSQIVGNIFSQVVGEANGSYGQAGLKFLGSPNTYNNLILGLKLWDAKFPISNPAKASHNLVIGSIDGGYGNDPNIYFDTSNVNNGWNSLSAASVSISGNLNANGTQLSSAAKLSSSVSNVPVIATPAIGHVACVKSAGPPVVLGSCSTEPTANGACTCE